MTPAIAEQAKAALRRHVLEPLLTRCVDKEHGGFLVDFDERWRSAGPHEKSLEHAARTTMAFTLLDRVMPGEGCDRLARHGCAFLQEVMWDAQHGGFFARVDRTGQPLFDGLKHPHAVTYAARAFKLAEHLLPAGEGERWASRSLGWLDDVAWDRRDGGYWGSYRRDNEPYAAGTPLPTSDGRDTLGFSPGFKELNTQCDAMEMLILFVKRGHPGNCADRLSWLIELMTDRLVDRYGILSYVYRRDWQPVPDLVRVGFPFVMARNLALAPGSPDRGGKSIAVSRRLVEFCLNFARHPEGGFCFAVSAAGRSWPGAGPSSDLRQWWVQLEALHTLHILSRHDAVDRQSRAKYRQACEEQWTFVVNRFFDDRYGGVRELPLDAGPRRWTDSVPRWLFQRPPSPVPLKTHPWKDPLHEVGTLLALAGEGT